MRRTYCLFCLTLGLILVAACASQPSEEKTAREQQALEEHAATETNRCLDNPELAKHWGDCNVKSVLFEHKDALAKCHVLSKKTKSVFLLQIKVKGNGAVKNVHIDDATAAGPLGNCLRKEIRKLRFAPPPAGTEPLVSLPYQIRP